MGVIIKTMNSLHRESHTFCHYSPCYFCLFLLMLAMYLYIYSTIFFLSFFLFNIRSACETNFLTDLILLFNYNNSAQPIRADVYYFSFLGSSLSFPLLLVYSLLVFMSFFFSLSSVLVVVLIESILIKHPVCMTIKLSIFFFF